MTKGPPKCPSFTARLHHIINKEEVCEECKTFFLEYHRNRRANPTRRKQCPKCGKGVNGTQHTHCSNCRRLKPPRKKGKKAGTANRQKRVKELVGWMPSKGILIPIMREVETNVKKR